MSIRIRAMAKPRLCRLWAVAFAVSIAMTPETLVAQPVDPIVTGPNEIRFIGGWRIRWLDGDGDDYWTVFVRPGGTERFNRDETEMVFHILESGMWWLQLEIEGVPSSCEHTPPCSPASIIAFSRVSPGVFHLSGRTNDLDSDVLLELERIDLVGGVPPCKPIVSPTRQVFVPYAGVSDALNIFAAAGCQWTASKDNPGWPVALTGATGSGDGTVGYTVGPNTTGGRQTYTINVHPVGGDRALDQRFTILQPSVGVPQILPLLVGDRPFGAFPVGTTSPPRALAVINDGSVVVTINSANDCPNQGFRVLDIPPEGKTLQPNGGSWEFPVVFTPQRPGPHSCALSFPPDTQSTVLVEGTGAALGGPLSASLNAASYSPGQTMLLTAALSTLAEPRAVDAYIVLQLPTGQFLSLQIGGGLVAGIVPIARGFIPVNLEATLVQYTFSGGEPRGTYTWYSVLTEAGTVNLGSPLQQVTFAVP